MDNDTTDTTESVIIANFETTLSLLNMLDRDVHVAAEVIEQKAFSLLCFSTTVLIATVAAMLLIHGLGTAALVSVGSLFSTYLLHFLAIMQAVRLRTYRSIPGTVSSPSMDYYSVMMEYVNQSRINCLASVLVDYVGVREPEKLHTGSIEANKAVLSEKALWLHKAGWRLMILVAWCMILVLFALA